MTDKNYVSILGTRSNIPREISHDEVIAALKTVEDPEIMINIHDLGFIYAINIDPCGNVEIDMTLTAPGCPVADILPLAACNAVANLDNAGEVKVALVWDPPWSLDKLSEEARTLIEIF